MRALSCCEISKNGRFLRRNYDVNEPLFTSEPFLDVYDRTLLGCRINADETCKKSMVLIAVLILLHLKKFTSSEASQVSKEKSQQKEGEQDGSQPQPQESSNARLNACRNAHYNFAAKSENAWRKWYSSYAGIRESPGVNFWNEVNGGEVLVWCDLVRDFTTLLQEHIVPCGEQQPLVNPFQEFKDDEQVLRRAAEQ